MNWKTEHWKSSRTKEYEYIKRERGKKNENQNEGLKSVRVTHGSVEKAEMENRENE